MPPANVPHTKTKPLSALFTVVVATLCLYKYGRSSARGALAFRDRARAASSCRPARARCYAFDATFPRRTRALPNHGISPTLPRPAASLLALLLLPGQSPCSATLLCRPCSDAPCTHTPQKAPTRSHPVCSRSSATLDRHRCPGPNPGMPPADGGHRMFPARMSSRRLHGWTRLPRAGTSKLYRAGRERASLCLWGPWSLSLLTLQCAKPQQAPRTFLPSRMLFVRKLVGDAVLGSRA